MTTKSISIKGAERKFGGAVRKAVTLTSGDLHHVSLERETAGVVRLLNRDAEVSRRHSTLRGEEEGLNGVEGDRDPASH